MHQLHQHWVCNAPYSEKISAYGNIAQAAHYIRVVFEMNCLPTVCACVLSLEPSRDEEKRRGNHNKLLVLSLAAVLALILEKHP